MEILSVSQLNAYVQQLVESDRLLKRVWVEGELSNFKHHSSGHMYFTLRDEECAVRAVMFRSRAQLVSFRPENGMRVVLKGEVSVYPRDGIYQIYVERMEPSGIGALYLALEQTKQRLSADGLTDPLRKRPLPLLPKAVGIVTAPTGAAIRDLLSVIQRRYPRMHIVLAPAVVQGDEAVPSLIEGLQRLGRSGEVDVIIIGRGGGSREDLWAFNNEQLCRAIAACPVPVVSAVGHETDMSLSDLVADVRAATPSAAAELVVPVYSAMQDQVLQLALRLHRAVQTRAERARQRLVSLEQRPVLAQPLDRLRHPRQRVDQLAERLAHRVSPAGVTLLRGQVAEWERRLQACVSPQRAILLRRQVEEGDRRLRRWVAEDIWQRRRQIGTLAAMLDALSPLRVLQRGYAICRDEQEQVVRDAASVAVGATIDVVLSRGALTCSVLAKKEG